MGKVINDQSIVPELEIRSTKYISNNMNIMYFGFCFLFIAVLLGAWGVQELLNLSEYDIWETESVMHACEWDDKDKEIGVTVGQAQYRLDDSWYDGTEDEFLDLYEKMQNAVAKETVIRIRGIDDSYWFSLEFDGEEYVNFESTLANYRGSVGRSLFAGGTFFLLGIALVIGGIVEKKRDEES